MDSMWRGARRAGIALAVIVMGGLPWAAGEASAAATDIKINEVESSGGVPGDWIELYNAGSSPVDISGFRVLDNDNTHIPSVIPAATTLAVGGFYVVEEAALGFGLGAADSARLFAPDGTTLLDSYSWTAHATTTYGRCPDGTGGFTTTVASTKAGANSCTGSPTSTVPPTTIAALPAWPGDQAIQTVDNLNVFGGNLSGLFYEGSGSAAPGTLWAARNGPGSLFRLVFDGVNWVPDTANDWGTGKLVRYPGGTGEPDTEGVSFGGPTISDGLYISSERNNSANSVSRNSILRFDASATGTSLTATHEWNLTADLPATGANLGLEAITWIPDSFLTAQGMLDESKAHAYNPAEYPNHGTGLFFVALEANGAIYAYALDHTAGTFTRIATISSGLAGVMDLEFDRDLSDLWAVCDDTCNGRSKVLRIDAGTGKFVPVLAFERPASMPNINNEGFAIASAAECVANRKPAFWSDDSETAGHAIRRGNLPCAPLVVGPPAVVPEFPIVVLSSIAALVVLVGWVTFRGRRRPALVLAN